MGTSEVIKRGLVSSLILTSRGVSCIESCQEESQAGFGLYHFDPQVIEPQEKSWPTGPHTTQWTACKTKSKQATIGRSQY